MKGCPRGLPPTGCFLGPAGGTNMDWRSHITCKLPETFREASGKKGPSIWKTLVQGVQGPTGRNFACQESLARAVNNGLLTVPFLQG